MVTWPIFLLFQFQLFTGTRLLLTVLSAPSPHIASDSNQWCGKVSVTACVTNYLVVNGFCYDWSGVWASKIKKIFSFLPHHQKFVGNSFATYINLLTRYAQRAQ